MDGTDRTIKSRHYPFLMPIISFLHHSIIPFISLQCKISSIRLNQREVLWAMILDWRLAIAKGFYKSDDMPTIVNRDGGMQGWLASAGDTITYGFE